MKSFVSLLFILSMIIVNVASMPNVASENVKDKTSHDVKNVQEAVCGNGFTALGEKCYLFDETPLTWDSALSICNSLGGNLAHISDYDENRLIAEHLLDNYQGYSFFWVGASDAAVEGQWVWSDDNSPLSFTDWGYTQPDNSGEEDCLLLWEIENWAWGDGKCPEAHPFICQQ